MNNIKILKFFIFLILIPCFTWYSYWLVVPTVNGDAASYQALYDALSTATLDEVRVLGIFYVSSNELTPYLIWLGAKLGIEKNNFITFFNVILLCGLFFLPLRRKINFSTVFFSFLIITNFYVIVLLTSAERLKFAYVMLIIASFLTNKKKFLFFILSVTMHFQSIIFIAAQSVYIYAGKFKDSLFKNKLNNKKNENIKLFIIILIIFVFYIYFKDGLKAKIETSLDKSQGGIGELFQLFFLFIATIPIFKKKFQIISMFLMYGIAILFIGGSRVNMIAYSSVVYLMIAEGYLERFNIKIIPFYLISIYLSYKSIGYIERTFIQGHGWAL